MTCTSSSARCFLVKIRISNNLDWVREFVRTPRLATYNLILDPKNVSKDGQTSSNAFYTEYSPIFHNAGV